MIHLNIQVDGPKGSKLSFKRKKKKTEQQASNQIARNYPVKPDNKGVVPLNWNNQQVARSRLDLNSPRKESFDIKFFILDSNEFFFLFP
jgi:hypothetical protein